MSNTEVQYDTGPEVAHRSYPEVYEPPQPPLVPVPVPDQPQYYDQGHDNATKPEHHPGSPSATYAAPGYGYGSSHGTPATAFLAPHTTEKPSEGVPNPAGAEQPVGRKRTVCGCGLLVFVLSTIIAILAIAVIGLAAGTGVQAGRANDATAQLQRLQASVASAANQTTPTATSAAPAATSSAAVLDNGCSTNPGAVDGQQYLAFKLLGNSTFTMRCNRDVDGPVLMSTFAPDFNTCMDSCSGWTNYLPGLFGRNANTTCAGVSFIPLWVSKSAALAGGAPGSCYLKRGPLNSTAFKETNIGTPVHGAVLVG